MFNFRKKTDKYRQLELVFFLSIFFLFPILTDIEYRLNEQPCEHCDNRFSIVLLGRLLDGFFVIWPWIFFYQILLKRFFLRKRFGYFVLLTIGFLVGLEFYTLYVHYFSISKMDFLPKFIVSNYTRYFESKTLLHFSIIYVISRMLVLMALAYFIQSNLQDQKIKAIEAQKNEADLKFLRAQIQPHFFFNTLNNLYSLAFQGSKDTAPFIARLSDLMRYIIYESNNSKLPLSKEVEFINNYVAVQSIRFSDQISMSFEVESPLPDWQIEPLLLLPYFENAFKHGVENATRGGYVRGRLYSSRSFLCLEIINSISSDGETNGESGGIGLSNNRERLDLLYANRYELIIEQTKTEYFVSLKLSLEEQTALHNN